MIHHSYRENVLVGPEKNVWAKLIRKQLNMSFSRPRTSLRGDSAPRVVSILAVKNLAHNKMNFEKIMLPEKKITCQRTRRVNRSTAKEGFPVSLTFTTARASLNRFHKTTTLRASHLTVAIKISN